MQTAWRANPKRNGFARNSKNETASRAIQKTKQLRAQFKKRNGFARNSKNETASLWLNRAVTRIDAEQNRTVMEREGERQQVYTLIRNAIEA